MPLKESVFDATEKQRDSKLHLGFSYKGEIFKRSMSNFIFREEKRVGILSKMEDVVFYLIEHVKTIKTFVDYNKKKNYKDFN